MKTATNGVLKPGPTPGRPPGDGTSRLYLVRHGTTTMNVENRYRGRRDVPLDDQGYQDAREAARFLSKMGLSAVYAGPLQRTIATAEIIAQASEVADVRIIPGLTNLDYGVWEGMTSEEAAIHDPQAYRLYQVRPLECVCPNGERLSDAQGRMLDALQVIGLRHPGGSVAVVSHAVMIRLVIASIQDLHGQEWRTSIGRGSAVEVLMTEGRISLGTTVVATGTPDVGVEA